MSPTEHRLARAVEHHRAGRLGEARRLYRVILRSEPNHPDALHLLGVVAHQSGDQEEASRLIRRAIALNPDAAVFHANLGNVLAARGRPEEAVAAFRRALALRPDYVEALTGLGTVFAATERFEEAAASYREALARRPEHVEGLVNLGNVLTAQGALDEAIARYRAALALRPDHAIAHSNLIFALDFDPRTTAAEAFAERRSWNAAHAVPLAVHHRPHRNDRDPDRKLRIGYVSADFRRHSAATSFGPVILDHDREAFEVVCYSGVTEPDEVTARFHEAAARWRSTLGLTDEELARRIRDDRIDILVDLAGHSAGNRLRVFAMKPAPIQCTGWGYAAGTGLDAIDYLFADRLSEPPEHRGFLAEEVVELPSLTVYDPPRPSPEVAPPPALTTGSLTLGCFNRPEKITPETLAAWAEVLTRLPGAALLIKFRGFEIESNQARILAALTGAGVAPERVRFLGGSSTWDHLAAYGGVDLALDPFPHGGNITAADALWMGVPSVTLLGARSPGRMCASLLTSVGLADFVAATPAEYVTLACERAGETDRLARLRRELRERLAASPACDHLGYRHAVEDAYRAMWRRWCGGRAG